MNYQSMPEPNASSDQPADEVIATISKFIAANLLRTPETQISSEQDLVGTGMIDSMGIMRLVEHIETSFDISVAPEDVTIENFLNTQLMAEYVLRSQSQN